MGIMVFSLLRGNAGFISSTIVEFLLIAMGATRSYQDDSKDDDKNKEDNRRLSTA